MNAIRILAAALTLALAACGTPQQSAAAGDTLLIDVPSGPFPYNSRFCP